jgi:hypothetical protein
MPFGSGRKKGSEWTEVSEIEGDRLSVQCDHCLQKISAKIERVRNHLEKCKDRQKNKEPEPRPSSSMSNISSLSMESDVSLSEGSSASSSTPAKKFKAGSLKDFVVKTSHGQKDALDKQVARFFFSSNIPFKSVESPEFVKLCADLRPGYTPPSRRKIGGDLLEEVYDDIPAEMRSTI